MGRQTDRQTDTETLRLRERERWCGQTDRQTDTETQTKTEREREMVWADRQTDRTETVRGKIQTRECVYVLNHTTSLVLYTTITLHHFG